MHSGVGVGARFYVSNAFWNVVIIYNTRKRSGLAYLQNNNPSSKTRVAF